MKYIVLNIAADGLLGEEYLILCELHIEFIDSPKEYEYDSLGFFHALGFIYLFWYLSLNSLFAWFENMIDRC